MREIQNSIKDSVKQLIEDEIKVQGVRPLFRITDNEISCAKTDSLFVFKGLQNPSTLKSLASFNRAWYEEAQALSKRSLELALPTFRETRTTGRIEQWFSWNRFKPDDPVEVLFRDNKDDPNFVCIHVNYYDNPWFPDNLRRQMERDKARDPEKYQHVWLGHYWERSEASVFRNWRIAKVDPPKPGTTLLLGADWGFTIDPTVLILGYIVGRTLYVWREVWELGCGIDRRGALFDKIDPEWTPVKARDPQWQSLARRHRITADSAEPQTIDYLQKHGFPQMKAAVKGPGSVAEGVMFLQDYDIVVDPECVNVARELKDYSFKVDKKTEKVLPELADDDNHTIDSLRYAVESVRHRNVSSQRPLGI